MGLMSLKEGISLYHVTIQQEKVSNCKPGEEPSSDTILAGILILNFPASRTVRNKLV